MSDQENNTIFELSEEDSAALAQMQESEVEEEVAEEQAPEPDQANAEEERAKPKIKTVPHAAMHEERLKRQSAEREAQQYREMLTRLNERLTRVEDAPPPPPDPAEHPIEALQYERQQREALQRRLDEESAQRQQQAHQQNYETQVRNYAMASEAEFRKQNPAYDEAVNHLRSSRAAELALFNLNPQQIEAQLTYEAMSLAQTCAQQGYDFGDFVYRLAETKGYKPAPDKSGAEEKIKTVSQGQDRAKSLSAAGGKSSGAEMTVESLLKMENDEFDAWCRKNPAKAKALLGG